jgi:hypothetical protein
MVLVTLAVVLVVLVGFLALSVDLGRVYIVKGELRNYAEAAAFAAALNINGLQSGVSAAKAAIAATPNKWDFSTKVVAPENVNVAFAPTGTGDSNGLWHTNPTVAEAKNDIFVRVTATATVPLMFLPVVGGPNAQILNATAAAGKVETPTIAAGNLIPLAPLAPDPANATTYGFEVGTAYSLRWSSNIGNNGNPPNGSVCAGDNASMIARQRTRDPHRGWWGSSSTSQLSNWIANGYDAALSKGDTIQTYPGTKNGNKNAMDARVQSDTDRVSTTFSQYEGAATSGGFRLGNGRRVVVVPVIEGTTGSPSNNGGKKEKKKDNADDDADDDYPGGSGSGETVLGFAAFFLNDLNYASTHGNEPYCGTFIGAYTMGANARSGGGKGVTRVRLVK